MWPVLPEPGERGDIDGNPRVFDPGGRLHVATAIDRPRDVQGWDHPAEEPFEGAHVAGTIGENGVAFGIRPWTSAQDEVAHPLLLGGLEAAQSKPSQCPEEAVTARDLLAVGEVPKLHEEIEDMDWDWPAESEMAANFSTRVVRHEQRIGAGLVRRGLVAM
jgi:hypothetical protein